MDSSLKYKTWNHIENSLEGFDWIRGVVGEKDTLHAIGHECPAYDWLGSFIECFGRNILALATASIPYSQLSNII